MKQGCGKGGKSHAVSRGERKQACLIVGSKELNLYDTYDMKKIKVIP